MESYVQMQRRHMKQSEEASKKPAIFCAFSESQYKEALDEYLAAGYSLENLISTEGGFYGDSTAVEKWYRLLKSQTKELEEAMTNRDFAINAYYYEMCNHEYCINWDGDWDVLRVFGYESLDELDSEQRIYYTAALRKYWKAAEENGWG